MFIAPTDGAARVIAERAWAMHHENFVATSLRIGGKPGPPGYKGFLRPTVASSMARPTRSARRWSTSSTSSARTTTILRRRSSGAICRTPRPASRSGCSSPR
ncbi:MAG: hypothetical protein R2710_06470 [Acidimicrobiales bacterium]